MQRRISISSRRCRAAIAFGSATLMAGFLLGPFLGSSTAAVSNARSIASSPTSTLRGSVDAPRESWWNEEWARIVGTQGSWGVESRVDRIILRPEGRTSRLDVLSRLSGRIHAYEFESTGEVLLAHGWIMISPEGPCALSAAPVEEAPGEAALQWNWARRPFKPFLELVELHGEVDWEVQLPPDLGDQFRLVSRHPAGTPQNSIRMQHSWGDSVSVTSDPDYPLFTLTLERLGPLGSPNEHSSITVTASRPR